MAVPETREWIYKKLKEYQAIKHQKAVKTQKSTKLSQKHSIQPNEPNPFEKPTIPINKPAWSPSIDPVKQ